MRTALFVTFLLMCAATASACDSFWMVPSEHIVVHHFGTLPSGATSSAPVVSVNGSAITVSRNVSGGSSVDSTCVDDSLDLGLLAAGRYTVTWTDHIGLSDRRTEFTFAVAGVFNGSTWHTALLPPATLDKPVRLELMGCSATPVVGFVVGHDIRVLQHGNDSSSCRLYVLDLGLLPAGTYNVITWRDPPDNVSDAPFSFIVQQPPPSSSCGGGTRVTGTADGKVHFHYEESFSGYAPSFGPPTVSEIACDGPFGCTITVTQPVADIADRTVPGAAPTQSFCHAEDLDLGLAPSSVNDVTWDDVVSVFGGKVDEQGRYVVRFVSNNGRVCTNQSVLELPSVMIAGEGFQVARNAAEGGISQVLVSLTVTAVGYVITVNEQLAENRGPVPEFFADCYRQTATIPPLPAGQYTLDWIVTNFDPALPPPHSVQTSTRLTVTNPTHRRAARH